MRVKARELLTDKLPLRLLLGVVSALCVAPGIVGAQDTSALSDDRMELETVTVTGSRIRRTTADYASPTTILNEDLFEHVGDTNIIRELHKVPQIAPSRGPTQGSGFSGSFVDLRGMGFNRTLVLVNGRRYISSLSDGGVDVSTIPPELIARVELVTGGGSATYGSDAIAGVVNFILHDDFEGIKVTAQTGFTDRDEQSTRHYGLLAGTRFAESGYAYLSLGYDEAKLILPGDRDFANVALSNVGGQLVPGTSSYLGTGVANAPPFGGPAIFNSSGELFSEPGVINPLLASGRFNTAVGANLQQPQELKTLHAGVRYPINDTFELYTEASFIDSETARELVSNAVDITAPVTVDNPFLGPLTQAYLAGLDIDGDGLVQFPGLRRRFNEVGPGGAFTPRTSYRLLAGVTVSLPGDWELDANAISQGSRFNWEARGAVGFDQLSQALQATRDEDGNIVCRDPRFGCVPVDVFRPNAITPEAANFLRVTPKVKSSNEDTIVSISATGTLFQLPAGPVGAAVGGEYLRFEASEVPDQVLTDGRSSAERFTFAAGENQSTEYFGELSVPLLSNIPAVEYLGIETGVRYSDFEASGGVWTYKGLLEWAPLQGLKFRGGVQRAIRQPAVYERFAGDAFIDFINNDPCFTGAPLTGALRGACIASGMPAALADAGVPESSEAYQYLNRDIASPDLAPETADSYTIGVVFQDFGIEGLMSSIDYYDIKIDDGINVFGRDLIFRQCYDLASDANNLYCGLIRREATGQIEELNNVRVNTAELRRTGIDFAVSYPFSFGETGGTLQASLNGNYRLNHSLLPTKLSPEDELECVGYYSPSCGGTRSRLQMLGSLGWSKGPATISMSWIYIGGGKDVWVRDNPSGAATLFRTEVPSTSYFDLYSSWRLFDAVELFMGVNNVLDKEPPIVGGDRASTGNTFPAQYDLIGRRYYLGTRVNF